MDIMDVNGSRLGLMRNTLSLILLGFLRISMALRPLRESASASSGSWGDELFIKREDSDPSTYFAWNITGTYRGSWSFAEKPNNASRFLTFGKSNGVTVLELVSTPTKISSVHYVQGSVTFHDVFENEGDLRVAQMRVEGIYLWPFRELRMVVNSGTDGEPFQEEDYFLSNPYHLLGVFSSQVLQESSRDKITRKKSLTYEMEKHCNIEVAAQVSHISSAQNDGDHERYHLEGLIESPFTNDDRECFSPILLNATSLNIEMYYNKAVNYTLMVTFVSFLQALLLIRQMDYSNTQSGAAKVSILMIGQQAITDAYLCLLHLTAGILVDTPKGCSASSTSKGCDPTSTPKGCGGIQPKGLRSFFDRKGLRRHPTPKGCDPSSTPKGCGKVSDYEISE